MKKQNAPEGAAAPSNADDTIADPRFASFTTDPRFRLPSKKRTQTKIDKRFTRMLKDEDFSNTAKVDRYGRKLNLKAKKEALKRLYQPEEDVEEKNEDVEEARDLEIGDVRVDDDELVKKELKKANEKAKGYDPAREGGFSSSSEDGDEDEDGDLEVEDVAEFPDMHFEQAGVPMGEVTSRIAVVNLDWDNIRATDLMAVFSSFLGGAGKIEKISVYRSEFGAERIEREEMEGPPREIFAKKRRLDEEEEIDSEDESEGEDDEDVDEDEADERIKKDLLKEDDGQEFDNAALRQYQLERLRYYYAVMVCSDKETANHIYEATDGTEYLSSANFIDLRFIPDDVEFNEKPRDECDNVPTAYRPTEFVTHALQHSKVKLTWDAEDAERKDVIKRAFSGSRAEISENDLQAYLGSDSSGDEDDGVKGDDTDALRLTKKQLARQKMRAALGLSDEPSLINSKAAKTGHVGDMEITFTAGLSADAKGGIFENKPIKEETTAEAYIRKERERKARRKDKAKALREARDPAAADTKAQPPPPQDDAGFGDPFFTTDETAKEKASKNLRKEERHKKREAEAAEAAAQASNRAELELLMTNNSNSMPTNQLGHFDINEIARAEKEAKKKRQRSKRGTREGTEGGGDGSRMRGGLQPGFEMDVLDPRFSAVFEKHEYAIDPSNPKFKPTEGMKKLLEEGRRKRGGTNEVGNDIPVGVIEKVKKRRVSDEVEANANVNDSSGLVNKGELKGLVEGLKKKMKR